MPFLQTSSDVQQRQHRTINEQLLAHTVGSEDATLGVSAPELLFVNSYHTLQNNAEYVTTKAPNTRFRG